MSEHNIHIFLGNDEFNMRKQVDKFAAQFTDPTFAEMNTSRLDTLLASESDLASAIGAMPFLAEKRLVILENISRRFSGLDGHKKFVSLLDSIPPTTRLVVFEPEEIKERDIPDHWLVKWAGSHSDKAEYKIFTLPRQREMPGWIVAEAKRQGGTIESLAAARLAEMTGEDTRQAALEITKLLTYVNYAHPIGVEDVEELSITTASVDIFKLVDALGAQDGRVAQKLFHRLLEDRDAMEIFSLVVRQFRLLAMARDAMDENLTKQEVSVKTGIHTFVLDKVFDQARNFKQETLKAIYHRLLGMDEAAKTGGMPLDTSIDILIVELAGKR